ncbi:MAG: hypothetical protein AAF663_11510 [Planctomycetota bacterium]
MQSENTVDLIDWHVGTNAVDQVLGITCPSSPSLTDLSRTLKRRHITNRRESFVIMLMQGLGCCEQRRYPTLRLKPA